MLQKLNNESIRKLRIWVSTFLVTLWGACEHKSWEIFDCSEISQPVFSTRDQKENQWKQNPLSTPVWTGVWHLAACMDRICAVCDTTEFNWGLSRPLLWLQLAQRRVRKIQLCTFILWLGLFGSEEALTGRLSCKR